MLSNKEIGQAMKIKLDAHLAGISRFCRGHPPGP